MTHRSNSDFQIFLKPALRAGFAIIAPFLAFSALFWAHPTHAVARGVFRPSMKNLRVTTVVASQKTPQMDECQLAKKAFRGHMPHKAIIGIEGNSYLFEKGIATQVADAQYIYLMSRGHTRKRSISGPGKDAHFTHKGGGLIHTRDRIAQRAVHLQNGAVAVTFDYQDRYISFGQRRNVLCLEFVYDAIKKINPTAHIIVVAECLGAKTALGLAIKKQPKNCTLMLESPFFVAGDLFDAMAKNYMGFPRLTPIITKFFKWFHHYDPRQDDLLDRLDHLPKDLRIFVCHRNNDKLIFDSQVEQGINQIKKHIPAHNVTFYRFDDTEIYHSCSLRKEDAQKAVNQFYAQHKLPNSYAQFFENNPPALQHFSPMILAKNLYSWFQTTIFGAPDLIT